MNKDNNKILAVSLIVLLGVFLSYFIYNIYSEIKIFNIKKNPIIIESQTSEKYVLSVLENDPTKGTKDAIITIFIFSNFEILENKDLYVIFDSLLKKYPGKVNLVWKDFWASDDYLSSSASIAARCANEQGKYWEFAEKLFEIPNNLNRKNYQKIVQELKLDESKFFTCSDSNKYTQDIIFNLSEGEVLDIKDIPSVFINQQKISGDISYDNLDNVIKAIVQ